jgi:hypothetical protein
MGLFKEEKDRNAFYNKSGYDRIRSKMLKSMSLVEFLNLIDSHAKDGDQQTFVTTFIELMH